MNEPFPDARTLLRRHGLAAKKSWGQNFLVSERAYRAIVDATVTADDDWIVELGAGLGTLTMRLAQRVAEGKVIAVERDRDLAEVLRVELGHMEDVNIVEANALTYDFATIARWRGWPIAVCGNLPYNIASQILFRIVEQRQHISRAVVMIQREMADRLVAAPGSRTYGALSVLLQTWFDIDTVIRVKPGAFVPPPRVASTVVRMVTLDKAKPRVDIGDPQRYSEVVHAAFEQRRKTLRNALRARFGDEPVDAALAATGIEGVRRGETLEITEFAQLALELADA